jgi:hypothetical protein
MGRILRKLKVIRKTITIKEVLSRLKLIKSIRFDKNSEENVQILKKYAEANNKVYVEGFYFRPLELTAKYQDLFMRRYGLKDVYYRGNEFVKTFMEKKNEYTVVGIHIRRGDYKTWFNGIFWFEDEVYQRFMDDFLNEYNEINCGKPPFFVVFSNGEHSFKDSPSLLVSHETWYIDHLLLSKCDYIIGPVSTFTLWASYIGKVNYFHIDNRDAQLGLEKFQICRGLFSSE